MLTPAFGPLRVRLGHCPHLVLAAQIQRIMSPFPQAVSGHHSSAPGLRRQGKTDPTSKDRIPSLRKAASAAILYKQRPQGVPDHSPPGGAAPLLGVPWPPAAHPYVHAGAQPRCRQPQGKQLTLNLQGRVS